LVEVKTLGRFAIAASIEVFFNSFVMICVCPGSKKGGVWCFMIQGSKDLSNLFGGFAFTINNFRKTISELSMMIDFCKA
jgi:hypothetical protein